jgi:HTH-type transcriptional regulator/antitoxin HigA
MLIERYETEIEGEFPDPDPIEANGYDSKDLAEVIELKSRASEILSRKRSMSINLLEH